MKAIAKHDCTVTLHVDIDAISLNTMRVSAHEVIEGILLQKQTNTGIMKDVLGNYTYMMKSGGYIIPIHSIHFNVTDDKPESEEKIFIARFINTFVKHYLTDNIRFMQFELLKYNIIMGESNDEYLAIHVRDERKGFIKTKFYNIKVKLSMDKFSFNIISIDDGHMKADIEL